MTICREQAGRLMVRSAQLLEETRRMKRELERKIYAEDIRHRKPTR